MRFRKAVHCNISSAIYAVTHCDLQAGDVLGLWCIEVDISISFLRCVTFDVLELLDGFSEPGHSLAPAVAFASPE